MRAKVGRVFPFSLPKSDAFPVLILLLNSVHRERGGENIIAEEDANVVTIDFPLLRSVASASELIWERLNA